MIAKGILDLVDCFCNYLHIKETAGGLRHCEYVNYTTTCLVSRLKRSLTGDFRPQVFFMNQFLPGAQIFTNESAVSTTPVIKEKNFEV
jgi:hypothetical protein